MPFKEKGFLGNEARLYPQRYRQEYKVYFDEAEYVNRVAHQFLERCQAEQEIQKLTAMTLYLRILTAYAAIFRLLELGLSQESGIIVRTLIEITIFHKKSCTSSEWVEKHAKLSQLHTLRYLEANYADDTMMASFSEQIKSDLKNRILELQEIVKTEKLRDISKSADFDVRCLAGSVGLSTLYETGYRLYSTESAHPSSNSLEGFFNVDESGKPIAIKYGPLMKDVSRISATAYTCIGYAIEAMEKLYGMENDLSNQLNKRIGNFMKKIPRPT
jgi:hypothetical protein